MAQNYSISARIDAQAFVTVAADLQRRGAPFGSIGDVITILCHHYMSVNELEPLTYEQTVLAMQDMGLSTNRLKAFQAGRSGLPGLSSIAKAALKTLTPSTPNHPCPSEEEPKQEEEEIPNV